MSSDAIIEGLKQGNAVEMATIEEVKAGMTSILDGMPKECYNRSYGLSELTEKLSMDSSSAATTNITPGQRTQLAKAINDTIRNCQQAMSDNEVKYESDYHQKQLDFTAERAVFGIITNHFKAHDKFCEQRRNLLNNQIRDLEVHAQLREIHVEETDLINKHWGLKEDTRQDFRDKKLRHEEEFEKAHEKAQSALKKQIASLEGIAVIAGIDLEATSKDEMSEGIPIHEAQAAPMSHVSSTVVRGRGGFFSASYGLGGRGDLGGRGRGRGADVGIQWHGPVGGRSPF